MLARAQQQRAGNARGYVRRVGVVVLGIASALALSVGSATAEDEDGLPWAGGGLAEVTDTVDEAVGAVDEAVGAAEDVVRTTANEVIDAGAEGGGAAADETARRDGPGERDADDAAVEDDPAETATQVPDAGAPGDSQAGGQPDEGLPTPAVEVVAEPLDEPIEGAGRQLSHSLAEISPAIETVGDALSRLDAPIEAASDTVASAGGATSPLTEPVFDTVTSVDEPVAPVTDALGREVVAVTDLIEPITDPLTATTAPLTDPLSPLVSSVVAPLTPALDLVAPVGDPILEPIVPGRPPDGEAHRGRPPPEVADTRATGATAGHLLPRGSPQSDPRVAVSPDSSPIRPVGGAASSGPALAPDGAAVENHDPQPSDTPSDALDAGSAGAGSDGRHPVPRVATPPAAPSGPASPGQSHQQATGADRPTHDDEVGERAADPRATTMSTQHIGEPAVPPG